MPDKIKKLARKYRELLLYLFFGGCTVLVNTLAYSLLYEAAGVDNLFSTVLAWLAAVLFAYATNESFVFRAKPEAGRDRIRQLLLFLLCRGLTGALDVGIMVVAVDCMAWNGTLWKLLSNLIVTVLNYVFSKLFIFTKGKNGRPESLLQKSEQESIDKERKNSYYE